MRKLIWNWLGLTVVLLVVSCRAQVETAVSTPLPPAEAISEAEIVPTNTAVSQPSSTPTATIVSSTPRPPATATDLPTIAPPDVPALVWLPYATGNYGQPVHMLEDTALTLQEMPVSVEIFFDYANGWLAYGSEFWAATANQDSVTDLYLYNFATETDDLWAEQVGRAALSPASTSSEQVKVAVAIHNGQGFDLVLLLEPGNGVPLASNIDPFFSWSPNGRKIAYLRDGELFVTDAAGDSGDLPIASRVYQNSNWLGDAPLWLGDSGYLLYAAAPFTIVASDGSETFVPQAEDGSTLLEQRPFTMLYSTIHNQLIAESEGMFGSNVTLYQFGDGFATAVVVEQIEDAQLAGWYEEDKSVVIISGGEATILPLTPQE
ncbi:MAG: hypothetical protein GY805_22755 [Chloroflexi bacterium]|nr:hypothetical protein [Chloroflexota bacterium]